MEATLASPAAVACAAPGSAGAAGESTTYAGARRRTSVFGYQGSIANTSVTALHPVLSARAARAAASAGAAAAASARKRMVFEVADTRPKIAYRHARPTFIHVEGCVGGRRGARFACAPPCMVCRPRHRGQARVGRLGPRERPSHHSFLPTRISCWPSGPPGRAGRTSRR